jgi:hypothetical protein
MSSFDTLQELAGGLGWAFRTPWWPTSSYASAVRSFRRAFLEGSTCMLRCGSGSERTFDTHHNIRDTMFYNMREAAGV